jgi:hypothetical protein
MKIPICLGALAVVVNAGLLGAATPTSAPVPAPAAAAGPAPLVSGWSELKEGEGAGTFEMNAKNAVNPSPHLLRISVTKYPEAGKGRYGVKNAASVAVKQGAAYDIQFSGASEGIGVGLVFSLETDDGKVLARTTLPEIGRGTGGGAGAGAGAGAARGPAAAGTPAAPWRQYLVRLTARASAPNAHLTITPIEQVPVWIENLTIVERPQSR